MLYDYTICNGGRGPSSHYQGTTIMVKYELHVLGEKFLVEYGVELSNGVAIEDATDVAKAFSASRVLTVPTTEGDVTFIIPNGGVAAWIKIQNDQNWVVAM